MKEFKRESRNRPGTSGKDFKEYYTPENIEEAVKIMDKYGSVLKVIAGGTDIMVEYFDRLYDIKSWLDLKNITQLGNIDKNDDFIEIGALVTHTQLEKSKIIKEYLPVLANAAYDVGSPQIRNRGTIGGNIVTASPAGDLLPALMAYDAQFLLVSKMGERRVPANKFFTGPKRTVLKDNELLARVLIPLPDEKTYGSWRKVGKRKALIISSITLALVISFNDDNTINRVKACLGSVAPTPIEIKEVNGMMVGKKLEELNYKELGEKVADSISPIDDIRGTKEYRIDVSREIMINALEEIEEVVKAN